MYRPERITGHGDMEIWRAIFNHFTPIVSDLSIISMKSVAQTARTSRVLATVAYRVTTVPLIPTSITSNNTRTPSSRRYTASSSRAPASLASTQVGLLGSEPQVNYVPVPEGQRSFKKILIANR